MLSDELDGHTVQLILTHCLTNTWTPSSEMPVAWITGIRLSWILSLETHSQI